jgi:hypothetical protein
VPKTHRSRCKSPSCHYHSLQEGKTKGPEGREGGVSQERVAAGGGQTPSRQCSDGKTDMLTVAVEGARAVKVAILCNRGMQGGTGDAGWRGNLADATRRTGASSSVATPPHAQWCGSGIFTHTTRQAGTNRCRCSCPRWLHQGEAGGAGLEDVGIIRRSADRSAALPAGGRPVVRQRYLFIPAQHAVPWACALTVSVQVSI